jgi:hypothetical protein
MSETTFTNVDSDLGALIEFICRRMPIRGHLIEVARLQQQVKK